LNWLTGINVFIGFVNAFILWKLLTLPNLENSIDFGSIGTQIGILQTIIAIFALLLAVFAFIGFNEIKNFVTQKTTGRGLF